MALTNKLTAIADAIRAKTGGTEPLSLDDMVTEIGSISGGSSFPQITFSGDLTYLNYNKMYDWLFSEYQSYITFQDITSLKDGFHGTELEDLSGLTFNFSNNITNMNNIFTNSINLKQLPKIGNANTVLGADLGNLFSSCRKLRTIPNEWSNKINLNSNGQKTGMFNYCHSLREVPQNWLNNIYNNTTSYPTAVYYILFSFCTTLNEILNLNPVNVAYTANQFSGTFHFNLRLKNLTFKTDNGTPYVRSWKKQIIDLSNNVGYYAIQGYKDYILNYNSGITADKEVTDAASYALLKNDPDWFTGNVAYSRYNHDSAVATINSLPDTSAVATGTNINTIKFKGDAGSATDGGAINTLTSAEIAVATNKGWTVTLS